MNTVCIIIPIKDPSQLERDNPGNVKSSSKSSLGTYLPELHPPPGLPQGNVGTPRAVIREAIRKCLLPASALKEMGVRGEPAPPPERIFGEVKMRYAAHVASDDDDVRSNYHAKFTLQNIDTNSLLGWLSGGMGTA